MIDISNCPDTGLERKITAKDLYKLESVQQVILRCHISHYRPDGSKVENNRVKSYHRDLVASDSFCDPQTGRVWTAEENAEYKAAVKAIEDWNNTPEEERGPEPAAPAVTPITEYQFFYNLTQVPVKMDEMERAYIAARDLEGKFNN